MGLFSEAREKARAEARSSLQSQRDQGVERIGSLVGRAEASLRESPKDRLLRQFAPAPAGMAPRKKVTDRLVGASQKVGAAIGRAGRRLNEKAERIERESGGSSYLRGLKGR